MVQYFTKDGLQNLKDELRDLKENAGYHDARDKMSFILGRIEQLECAINEAVVKENDGTGCIQSGCKIVISFGGEKMEYEVVAPGESDILKNKISYQSPLGQMLLGHKVGKEFDFMAGDKKVKVKILEIK